MRRRRFLGWLGAVAAGVLVAPLRLAKALEKDDWLWSPRAFCPKCRRMMRERWAVWCDKCGGPTLVNTRFNGAPVRTADYIKEHPKLAEALKQDKLRRYKALMNEADRAWKPGKVGWLPAPGIYLSYEFVSGQRHTFKRRLSDEEIRLIYEVESEQF